MHAVLCYAEQCCVLSHAMSCCGACWMQVVEAWSYFGALGVTSHPLYRRQALEAVQMISEALDMTEGKARSLGEEQDAFLPRLFCWGKTGAGPLH